jgi:hypothetical protein
VFGVVVVGSKLVKSRDDSSVAAFQMMDRK